MVTLGELVCSPPESQLVSHDSLRNSDGSGFGNAPSTRDTCIASLNATTSSIATGLLAGRHLVHSGPGVLE